MEAAVAELSDLAGEPVWAELTLGVARALFNVDDKPAALAQVETVLRVAEEHYLPAAIADALVVKGMGLILTRRVREGLALIEGARALAHALTESLLRATLYGSTYVTELNVGVAFARLADGLAMARRVGRSWTTAFVVNIGYAGFLAGEWVAALAEMDTALAEDWEPTDRVALMNNHVIIRACRGEAVADDLAALERLVAHTDDPYMRTNLLDPQANAALADGRLEAAGAAWREIAELDETAIAEYRCRAARPRLWLGDAGQARVDLDAWEEASVPGPITDARRATMRAGLAALEGQSAQAVARYRDALRGWSELGSVWDEALTGMDMAELLDPADPEVAAAVKSTREILERLGARPFIERLDAAASRSTPQTELAAQSPSGVPLPAPPAP